MQSRLMTYSLISEDRIIKALPEDRFFKFLTHPDSIICLFCVCVSANFFNKSQRKRGYCSRKQCTVVLLYSLVDIPL